MAIRLENESILLLENGTEYWLESDTGDETAEELPGCAMLSESVASGEMDELTASGFMSEETASALMEDFACEDC